MNNLTRNILLVLSGLVIGLLIMWFWCHRGGKNCDHHAKCGPPKKCHKSQDGNYDVSTNYVGYSEFACVGPGYLNEENGIYVDKSIMDPAVARYQAFLGTELPDGALGGKIGLDVLSSLVRSVSSQPPSSQFLYYRLGLATPKSKTPTVYLIAGPCPDYPGKLQIFTSGARGFCPTLCTLPPGQ